MATTNNPCSYDGCTAPARSNVLHAICDTHYMARRRAIQDGKPWPTDMDGNYDPHTCPAHAIDKEQAFEQAPAEEQAPAPAPAPAPAAPANNGTAKSKAEILEELLSGGKDERVDELIARIATLENSISAHYRIDIHHDGDKVVKVEGLNHRVTPYVIDLVAADKMPYLVGPAGSGKTTLAEKVAAALDLDFYSTGAVVQKYELTGFVDATGTYQESSFYKAFKYGGLFLFDELDASSPAAIVAFNAALENGHWACPSGEMVIRHKDFRVIASANTYGKGATLSYVGRNPLDGSTVDRFAFVIMNYDFALTAAIKGVAYDGKQAPLRYTVKENSEHDISSYFRDVTLYADAVDAMGIKHIISPRAAINGIDMLRRNVKRSVVEESFIWKGLDGDSVKKIKQHAADALAKLDREEN